MATFSTRLQELKETKKLLQKDAAKALDVPLRTYQRYEHGQQEPQLSTPDPDGGFLRGHPGLSGGTERPGGPEES